MVRKRIRVTRVSGAREKERKKRRNNKEKSDLHTIQTERKGNKRARQLVSRPFCVPLATALIVPHRLLTFSKHFRSGSTRTAERACCCGAAIYPPPCVYHRNVKGREPCSCEPGNWFARQSVNLQQHRFFHFKKCRSVPSGLVSPSHLVQPNSQFVFLYPCSPYSD